MSRSASGALLAWTDKGGLSSSEKMDLLRIALRLAGFVPRLASGVKVTGANYTALLEALLPEGQRPGKRDMRLSLERCVSVMLGGVVPEDKVLTLLVNKKNAAGVFTQNCWQARAQRGLLCAALCACAWKPAARGVRCCSSRAWRQNPVFERCFAHAAPLPLPPSPPRRLTHTASPTPPHAAGARDQQGGARRVLYRGRSGVTRRDPRLGRGP
jgi:hypothetical protein